MEREERAKKRWTDLGEKARKFDSTLLKNAWLDCIRRELSPGAKKLLHASEEEQRETKRKTKAMYAYSNRVIQAVLHYTKRPLAYVLVDAAGTILKLYCDPEIRQWLQEKDVEEGTLLSAESAGVTAFSIGLAIMESYTTSGEEHYLDMFSDADMYFAPCILEDNSEEQFGKMNLLGGVGIIMPKTQYGGDYLPTVISICKEICLHIDMVDTFYRFYMTDTTGYICIDIDRSTRKPYTLYHNSNIFNVLGIPYRDLVFQSAYEIFDPLPSNQQLWDIVNNIKHVRNLDIPITVNGVTNQYSVSTEVYRQSKVGYEGIRFFISNEEKISTFFSRYLGNNALLNFNSIVGQSVNIKKAIKLAKRYAEFDNNVLILGESGCGKDIFAQAIHNASDRKNGPFIAINCATFPKDLMVSELFGYEAGAFTGSKKSGSIGKMELANNGTLFLDEIGTLPLDLQAILLRAIETKRFTKLGGNREISVNVRIIAATNEDIMNLVENKGFREDLYFRLATFVLNISPLRERREDIGLLANHFIERVSNRIHLAPPKLSPEALQYMETLRWRGNVRELQNFVEGIVQIYSPSVITLEHIEAYLAMTGIDQSAAAEKEIRQVREPEEKSVGGPGKAEIASMLKKYAGNKSKAAAALGMSRKTLYKWIGKYGIEPEEP
ncbi:sigma-54 interaction domain-containing protein [Vermiculatibacterium agrestimuris]|uniref:sigma-54 interaction domain-containing protein n=1 Tax=Vermiculatibacterium agrestimuris TaxID=2941519 RepID=UPI00203EEC12|nr:sigma 54-interacting transcriptional regulator [Vermiculatibacterium agrestimuris]